MNYQHGMQGRFWVLLTTAASAVLEVASVRADYQTTVLADQPLAYYPLNESTPWTPNVATNSGSLGGAGNAVSFAGEIFNESGAIVGDPDTAIRYTAIDINSNDGGVPTVIPYLTALNTSGSFRWKPGCGRPRKGPAMRSVRCSIARLPRKLMAGTATSGPPRGNRPAGI